MSNNIVTLYMLGSQTISFLMIWAHLSIKFWPFKDQVHVKSVRLKRKENQDRRKFRSSPYLVMLKSSLFKRKLYICYYHLRLSFFDGGLEFKYKLKFNKPIAFWQDKKWSIGKRFVKNLVFRTVSLDMLCWKNNFRCPVKVVSAIMHVYVYPVVS